MGKMEIKCTESKWEVIAIFPVDFKGFEPVAFDS